MSEAPIKTCDYCEKTGKMPTFMNGETTCLDCLGKAPKTLTEAKHIIHKLNYNIEKLKRGEFICTKCGLRKNNDSNEECHF